MTAARSRTASAATQQLKVRVVLGIDLAGASDERCVREHFLQFGHNGTVRPLLEAGGEDSRQLEVSGHVGQGQDAVLELAGCLVLDEGSQAALMVHEEDGGCAPGNAAVLVVTHQLLLELVITVVKPSRRLSWFPRASRRALPRMRQSRTPSGTIRR